jgi:hypothetical protein
MSIKKQNKTIIVREVNESPYRNYYLVNIDDIPSSLLDNIYDLENYEYVFGTYFLPTISNYTHIEQRIYKTNGKGNYLKKLINLNDPETIFVENIRYGKYKSIKHEPKNYDLTIYTQHGQLYESNAERETQIDNNDIITIYAQHGEGQSQINNNYQSKCTCECQYTCK